MVRVKKRGKISRSRTKITAINLPKEAELQRQIRDDVSLTMQERIAANNQLGIILNKQFEEEKAITDKKVLLAEMELSTNKGNIDLQVALTNSKTELAELDERITGQRSEQLTNLNALQKESVRH